MIYLDGAETRSLGVSSAFSIQDMPDEEEVMITRSSASFSGQTTERYDLPRSGDITHDRGKSLAGNDVTIAIMGATGSGKTSFINLVSGSSLRVGRGLKSCTNVVQIATPFELDGHMVTLIDTPGFDDTTKSDTEVLRMIAAFLATTYENKKRLAGVLYFHRISDFRMGGISTRNFKMFRELCGESTLKNVLVVTNMWGEVSKDVGEARERELATDDMFFKPVLAKGAELVRNDNTLATAQSIIMRLTDNRPLSLRIQRELVDQKKDISQTAAGAELNREMMEQIEKHRQELRSLQEEMREAIRTKDDETKKELEVETRKLQNEMNRVLADSQKLASDYNEEKSRLEGRMQELSNNAREEAERNAEYQRNISQLQLQLTRTEQTSAAEKQDIMRQLDELRNGHNKYGGGLGGDGFFRMIGGAIDMIFGIH